MLNHCSRLGREILVEFKFCYLLGQQIFVYRRVWYRFVNMQILVWFEDVIKALNVWVSHINVRTDTANLSKDRCCVETSSVFAQLNQQQTLCPLVLPNTTYFLFSIVEIIQTKFAYLH